MKILALTLPGSSPIQVPSGVPINTGPFGSSIIRIVINGLLIAAAILCVAFIIIGGIKIIISQGDPKNIAQGRDTIIYAAVGLLVAFLAYLFVTVLFQVFTGAKPPGLQ